MVGKFLPQRKFPMLFKLRRARRCIPWDTVVYAKQNRVEEEMEAVAHVSVHRRSSKCDVKLKNTWNNDAQFPQNRREYLPSSQVLPNLLLCFRVKFAVGFRSSLRKLDIVADDSRVKIFSVYPKGNYAMLSFARISPVVVLLQYYRNIQLDRIVMNHTIQRITLPRSSNERRIESTLEPLLLRKV